VKILKNGRNPTRSQKLAMKAVGINSNNWLALKRQIANYTWYIGKQIQQELLQGFKEVLNPVNLDIYFCKCNEEFAVLVDKEPKSCPFCESPEIDWSHETEKARCANIGP
jgi:rubrerythrin